VSIRPATEADLPALGELYREFLAEVPPPEYVDTDVEHELHEVAGYMREHVALVAEEDGRLTGFALARLKGPRHAYLSDLFVRADARRRGTAAALVREAAALLAGRGAEVLDLEVQSTNAAARAVYEHWGFRETIRTLAAPLGQVEQRLAQRERPRSVGSLHVQTDDEETVERTLAQFLPRLGRSEWSHVFPPENGWVTVTDELCDRDRSAQRRLGSELSDRLGVPAVAFAVEEEALVRFLLFERGRMVDEYLSVPSYYGALNKADELSLAANPTLVSRLTGADPARVRSVARVASSTAELPPPRELVADIAAAMGLVARIER
jgi:ribosomal protein S18 acetylase RimI-like enzyme